MAETDLDYLKVNEEKTNNLLNKFTNKIYMRQKKQNKRNTWKFIKGRVSRKWNILDVGCRDGLWMDILRHNRFKNLKGVDISKKALKISRKKGHNVIRCDAQELPFEDGEFNFVSIIHTLEHCPDVDKVIKGIHRILKENGRILVVVPLQKKEPVPTVWAHYHCFSTAKEVVELLERNGFKKITVQTKQRPHNRFLFRKIKNESTISYS